MFSPGLSSSVVLASEPLFGNFEAFCLLCLLAMFYTESWLAVALPRETSTGVVTGGGRVPPHEVVHSAIITWRLDIDAPRLERCYLVSRPLTRSGMHALV